MIFLECIGSRASLSATNIVNQLIKNLVHKFVHDMLDFNMISGIFLLSFKSENIHGETKE